MKALSVKPQWAAKILNGIKTIEIRSRSIRYRGELLICTSGRGTAVSGVPFGVTLCIVDVIDCRRMAADDVQASGGVPHDPTMFSWIITNVRPVHHVKIKGRLSFFDVPDHLITRKRDVKLGGIIAA
jgi:hypothetical protein